MLLVVLWIKLLTRELLEALQKWILLMRAMPQWTIRTHQIQMRHRMRLTL
jgi:hypothetical protein